MDGDAATLWAAFDEALSGTGSGPGLDILVNNAGITLPRPIAAVTEEEYDRVFAVNTRAPFFIVQRSLERLRDGGRIISISSAATQTAYPAIVAYSMSKGALDVLTAGPRQAAGPARHHGQHGRARLHRDRDQPDAEQPGDPQGPLLGVGLR